MNSKSEGTTVIYNLTGTKLRGRVIDVVEARPLSDKRGVDSINTRCNNRSNRRRKRKY